MCALSDVHLEQVNFVAEIQFDHLRETCRSAAAWAACFSPFPIPNKQKIKEENKWRKVEERDAILFLCFSRNNAHIRRRSQTAFGFMPTPSAFLLSIRLCLFIFCYVFVHLERGSLSPRCWQIRTSDSESVRSLAFSTFSMCISLTSTCPWQSQHVNKYA